MRQFYEEFIFCLGFDDFKLDSFDLKYLSCGLMLEIWLQVERDRIRLKRQDEKAAKEANKIKKKQQYQQAKEGKLPLQYQLITSLHLFYFHSRGSPISPDRTLFSGCI